MDLRLTGKPVLVSGSTAGIGHVIVETPAREGAGVSDFIEAIARNEV